MRGELYRLCGEEYGLHDAIWVPDAGLLFQREYPRGVWQVFRKPTFAESTTAVFQGDTVVPYRLITEAKKYLERQEHIQAQKDAVQTALDRLAQRTASNESRLQKVVRLLR